VSEGSTPVDFLIEKTGRAVTKQDVVVGKTMKPVVPGAHGGGAGRLECRADEGRPDRRSARRGRISPGRGRAAGCDARRDVCSAQGRSGLPHVLGRAQAEHRLRPRSKPDSSAVRPRRRGIPEPGVQRQDRGRRGRRHDRAVARPAPWNRWPCRPTSFPWARAGSIG
jgi:hypothetical protein